MSEKKRLSRYKKVYTCQYCKTEFIDYRCFDRKYCSKKCLNMALAKSRKKPVYLRVLENVDIKDPNECWPYMGTVDQHGYGKISSRHGRKGAPERVHRIIYEMVNGGIDKELFVLHKCDNPNCVNPNHLYMGTQTDNMQDVSRRNRMNKESFLNLRPGKKGYNGAGPKSKRELLNK